MSIISDKQKLVEALRTVKALADYTEDRINSIYTDASVASKKHRTTAPRASLKALRKAESVIQGAINVKVFHL